MTINEYFALKTQINQKWITIIFRLVLATFLFCLSILAVLICEKSKDIIDYYIIIISGILGFVIFMLALIKIIDTMSEKKTLETLYKNKKSFSEAASILKLIPEKN